MVNAVSMDNMEPAYAIQQLRKSWKNAEIVSVVDMVLQRDIFTNLLAC